MTDSAPPACMFVLRTKDDHKLYGVWDNKVDAFDARAKTAVGFPLVAYDLEVVTYQPPFTL